MKVLICGDRNWYDVQTIRARLKLLKEHYSDACVIHGDARGADRIAGKIAKEMGFEVKAFPADWKKYGKAAGPIRNIQMIEQKPDLVIAFHRNVAESKGTIHTLREARKRKILCELVTRTGVSGYWFMGGELSR